MSARIVMTSTRIPMEAEAAEILAGMDVEFEALDATTEDQLIAITRDADAIITLAEPFTRTVIESLERCRSITRFGIGVDNVDIPAATERGIWVTNVPDGNYREVAAHAIAMALSISRRLPLLDREMHAHGSAPMSLTAGIRRPDSQTFGLVGIGRIGRRVAIMARAIGYRVIVSDPAVDAAGASALGAELVSFDEVVEQSDILSLHTPLTDQTRNIVNADVISRMRPGSVLINVSRGGLVDERALAKAIREGRLIGAGIDAYEGEPGPMPEDHPLRELDEVILTPHSAHASAEALGEIKRKAIHDAARVVRGEAPLYPVNTPQRRAV